MATSPNRSGAKNSTRCWRASRKPGCRRKRLCAIVSVTTQPIWSRPVSRVAQALLPLPQPLPERFAPPPHGIHQLRPAFHQHFPSPDPAQIRLRFLATVLDRMQQPRFEVHQLRQFVCVPGIILRMKAADFQAYFTTIGRSRQETGLLIPSPRGNRLLFGSDLAGFGPTRYNRHGMLLELVVENYAVVERLRVHFHPGLNLLTGETGSGKSIVVDALGLLLGGRASAEMIRTGEARARLAGIFEVRDQAGVRRLLEPAGLELEEGELLIEREILASGKSRAFVGSRPVAVALLKDLAPLLGGIHGQHDQQLLFLSEAQRDMLDVFAGNRELLDSLARLYREWRAAVTELEELERNEQEKLRLLDLWSFQRKEIESAALF